MNKTLVFDMDGTIADLYGVDGWLEKLRNEDATPYTDATPIFNMNLLNTILDIFRAEGWKIVVTTWLSMGSTKEYDNEVRKAKIDWLKKVDFIYDEIHLVKYGTTKAKCTRHIGGFQILVDDNETIRKGWTLGDTIDANNDIIDKLMGLLLNE
jgi:FMN phosphatase YigB (HAD superfamily)